VVGALLSLRTAASILSRLLAAAFWMLGGVLALAAAAVARQPG
jgi:hypothetical protein